MSDEAKPTRRGRPPLARVAMTSAQRKARQRAKSETDPAGLTKERFCRHLIRDYLPYYVTSHVINETTWRPEYRAFWEALGVHSDKSRKQAEAWFLSERLAKKLRDKSQK